MLARSSALLAGSVLLLTVETQAQCPALQVDHWLNPESADADQYGTSIAIEGEWAAVGVSLDDDGPTFANCGSVYVYHRSPTGTWSSPPVRLLASDRAAGDEFGTSLDLAGGVLVVGARSADVPPSWNETGAAYVFEFDGVSSTWIERAKLRPSDYDQTTRPFFGESVAVSGATVVVGANFNDEPCQSPASECGKAYVFVRPVAGWNAPPTTPMIETRMLVAQTPTDNAQLGGSVDIDGSVVIAGAIYAKHTNSASSGRAYVYLEPVAGWASGTSPLTESCTLEPSYADDLGLSTDLFGGDVAVSSTMIAVGAWRARSASNSSAPRTGAVYVFHRPPANWSGVRTEDDKIVASPGDEGTLFGHGLELQANRLLVGAPIHNLPTSTQAGRAFVYEYDGVTWNETEWLIAADAANTDEFGYDVALDGDTALVAAIVDDHSGATDPGSAYVFDLDAPLLTSLCEPGLGEVIACPCGNAPAGPLRGCDNHGAASGGASFTLAGCPSILFDSLALSVMGENNTSLTLFLQGPSTSSTGIVFGAGVRCVTGPLKRLYTGNASGGSLNRPLAADPDVHTRSAALGDSLSAGDVRYYFPYYRDPQAVGPCSNSSSTFNCGNAGRAIWVP